MLPLFLLLLIVATLACTSTSQPAPDQVTPASQQSTSPPETLHSADVYGLHTGLKKMLSTATPDGQGRFYTGHLDGTIRIYDPETRSGRIVHTDLHAIHGLLVVQGRLYATHNNFCETLVERQERLKRIYYAKCSASGGVADNQWDPSNLGAFLSSVVGQIVSMEIGPDGGLSDLRIEVDQLPVGDREHAPHGFAYDGEWIYVSIGHPFNRPGDPENPPDPVRSQWFDLNMLTRPETAGSIIRFRPDAAQEYEVFATGLRNVYGISIGPDGNVYGLDNDIGSENDKDSIPGTAEELNVIKQGHFYGFPRWGTNVAPPEAGVTEPVAVLEGGGSTVALASKTGVFAAYIATDAGAVVDHFEYDTWTRSRIHEGPSSYNTALHEQDGKLYIFGITGRLTVISVDR